VQALAAVLAVTLLQPDSTGARLSVTVTMKEHEFVLGGTAASEAEQLMVVTPLLKVDPEAGEQVTVRDPSQLSVAVG